MASNLESGAWVLDPFGATPRLAIEAARAGYRVVVTANNPIDRYLLALTIAPPDPETLIAAFADLGQFQKGTERLEPHLQSQYHTRCERCEKTIEAEAFIWTRGALEPHARIYQCPFCGDSGERSCTREDIELAWKFPVKGMHWFRLLEKITPANDPERELAEEALSIYTPRAIYVLATLLNRMDSVPERQREYIRCLVFCILDQATQLWPYPHLRSRPRQLIAPSRFRENNLWMALEAANSFFLECGKNKTNHSPQLVTWPQIPSEAGQICLYPGRLRDFTLEEKAREIPFRAVLTVVPRPNQAYWTLSTLWSAWLWGKDAARPIKSVIRRRRYDWAWHTSALNFQFIHVSRLVQAGASVFAVLNEIEPGFLTAAIAAAAGAGWDLAGIALSLEEEQAQIHWKIQQISGQHGEMDDAEIEQSAQSAARNHLLVRGEPARYLTLHASALTALPRTCFMSSFDAGQLPSLPGKLQSIFQKAFTPQNGIIRYGSSDHSLDVGFWWLSEQDEQREINTIPLSDRIEISLVRYLIKHLECTENQILDHLSLDFPGLFTPNREFVRICLESYAQQNPSARGWSLRAEDAPAARRADVEALTSSLFTLGRSLGFEVTQMDIERKPVVWSRADKEAEFIFYVIASAVFGEIAQKNQTVPQNRIIICPGSRSKIVHYKLMNNPHLKKLVESQWKFVKFRHIRRLTESSTLNLLNFQAQLELDPLSSSDPQIKLL